MEGSTDPSAQGAAGPVQRADSWRTGWRQMAD